MHRSLSDTKSMFFYETINVIVCERVLTENQSLCHKQNYNILKFCYYQKMALQTEH